MTLTEPTQQEMLNVKFIREALGLSQQKFADLLGVSRQTIVNWESGSKIPDTKMMKLEEIEAKIEESAKPGSPNYRPDVWEHKAKVNEPSQTYQPEATDLLSKFIQATEENRRLTQTIDQLRLEAQQDMIVIQKMKHLFEKHGIDFSHITEP